jgi:hypothetical protein
LKIINDSDQSISLSPPAEWKDQDFSTQAPSLLLMEDVKHEQLLM